MYKIISATLVACGLLLLGTPNAAADEEEHHRGEREYREAPYYQYGRDSYRRNYNRDGYRYRYDDDGYRYKRSKKMPRWLKRDRSFRRWIKHSRLRKNRYLSWNQLFDIYRWEISYYRYDRH